SLTPLYPLSLHDALPISTVSFTERDSVSKYFPGRLLFTDLFHHGTHTGATVSSNAVREAGITSGTTLVAVKVCGYINECPFSSRSEEHTSELQSRFDLVC